MKTSFHRLNTADGIELHGLLYEPEIKTTSVLIHVHGMGDNFYQNKFVDSIAHTLTDRGIALCVFNNRGCELMKDTYKTENNGSPQIVRVGGAYEKFEDCIVDIQAVIDFAESSFSDIHLSGHSLGCPKISYYLAETNDKRIKSLALLSPADMLGLVRVDAQQFALDNAEALQLVATGNGEQLLTHWIWDEVPLSANTYLSLFGDDAPAGIFNFYDPADQLATLHKITVPTFAVMGRKDDALVVSIEETFSRIETALVNAGKVETTILGDANHGFTGDEQAIADAVTGWVMQNIP